MEGEELMVYVTTDFVELCKKWLTKIHTPKEYKIQIFKQQSTIGKLLNKLSYLS